MIQWLSVCKFVSLFATLQIRENVEAYIITKHCARDLNTSCTILQRSAPYKNE